MRGQLRTVVAVLPVAGALALAGGAPASAQSGVQLQPIDGGHWQSQVGLPDSRGGADQALVRLVDGADHHPEVAAITGLEGADTSSLDRVGFTVAGEEVGIIPCIRVAFTDATGTERELMITSRTMRAQPSRESGWTTYTFDAGLPPGGMLTALEIGLHVEPTAGERRVRFDDVVVNDQVFTQAADNGA